MVPDKHCEQEGRFFHGHSYYYCHPPLYVFCGRHLLVAKLPSGAMDAAAGEVEEVARGYACAFRCAPLRLRTRGRDGLVRGRRRRLPVDWPRMRGTSPRYDKSDPKPPQHLQRGG
jgi:hypothetical protein